MFRYWCITKRNKRTFHFFFSVKNFFLEKSTPDNDKKQLRPITDHKHVDTLQKSKSFETNCIEDCWTNFQFTSGNFSSWSIHGDVSKMGEIWKCETNKRSPKKPAKHWSLFILIHSLKIMIFNHVQRVLVTKGSQRGPTDLLRPQ